MTDLKKALIEKADPEVEKLFQERKNTIKAGYLIGYVWEHGRKVATVVVTKKGRFGWAKAAVKRGDSFDKEVGLKLALTRAVVDRCSARRGSVLPQGVAKVATYLYAKGDRIWPDSAPIFLQDEKGPALPDIEEQFSLSHE